MSIRVVLLSSTLLLFSLNTHAQTTIRHYIGGDLGLSMRKQHFFFLQTAEDTDGHLHQIPSKQKLTFNMFSGSIYYGLAFNDKLAIEFTWTSPWNHKEEQESSYSEDDPDYPGYKDKFFLNGHLFDVTALYRPLDRIPGFFLRGGVSHSSSQATSEWVDDYGGIGNTDPHHYVIQSETDSKTSGLGMVFGLGYEHPIYKNLHVRASYTYYHGLSSYASSYSNNFKIGLNYGF